MSIPKQYNRRKFDRLHTNLQYISDQIPKVDFSNYNITENDCYEYLRDIELARQKLKKKKDSWKNKITWISILFTCIMFILSVLGVFIMYPFFSIVKVLFPSFPIFAIILPFFIAIISGGGLHELLKKRISLFDTNCSFFPTINYEIENIFNDCLNNNKNIYNAPYLNEKKEIKENWKDEFGAKYNSDYKILIKVPSNLSSYTIIDGTEIIGERAFAVCINGLSTYSIWPNNSLKQVLLPNTIRKIEAWAFSRCKNIQTILLPNSLKEIGSYAFYNCSNLTSMIIPDSVNNIGNDAFSGCLSLSSVTIPNSVTEIGRGVFCYCTGLTSITIPNSVTNIGNSAFRGCWKLSSVTIPNSVTTIGERTFEDCTKLTSVTIPNSVKTIGDSAFYGCI
ncbi:MAG: leucine-rich repeat protein [Prevotella sp.]|nr:leucine-rich repeat protein [Prevotella sp.]